MYYPVAVAGGLLSVGDSHASQGDSELCGTTIECSLTGMLQLILHKRSSLGGTALEGLDYPLLETQDEWVVHGFSFANYLTDLGAEAQQKSFEKSSLDLAMRDALQSAAFFDDHPGPERG
jgi:acetamidase/formamidase